MRMTKNIGRCISVNAISCAFIERVGTEGRRQGGSANYLIYLRKVSLSLQECARELGPDKSKVKSVLPIAQLFKIHFIAKILLRIQTTGLEV